MSLRFKSLDDLGRGAWRIASEISLKQPVQSRKSAPRPPSGPTPHDLLWAAVHLRWPEAQRELPGAVEGRRFRLDIGFAAARLAVEVDGFAYHGKHLGDFKRDRERQNLLTVAGWRILRFTASDIRKTPERCLELIEAALRLNDEVNHG